MIENGIHMVRDLVFRFPGLYGSNMTSYAVVIIELSISAPDADICDKNVGLCVLATHMNFAVSKREWTHVCHTCLSFAVLLKGGGGVFVSSAKLLNRLIADLRPSVLKGYTDPTPVSIHRVYKQPFHSDCGECWGAGNV